MDTATTIARTLWTSGWGIFHMIVWLALVVFTGGFALVSLLWIIPGVVARGDRRTAVNAFGWLVWLGPFGLIAALRAKR